MTQHYARIRWTDKAGVRRERRRRATSKVHAKQIRRQLIEELERELAAADQPRQDMTFAELASWYEEKYLVEPRYIDDRRVSGLASWKEERRLVKHLVEAFGGVTLDQLNHARLSEYRAKRLAEAQPGRTNITAVDREFQRLRAMLNKAIHAEWLAVNPFHQGDTLITVALENTRERILRRREETALLKQCVGPRAHLYAAIVFALDTTIRASEQFRLSWANVDWANNVITLAAQNTKAKVRRTVPISSRLRPLLVELFECSDKQMTSRVFRYTRMKRSFSTACRLAGITNFKWRDLRATGISALVDAGIGDAQGMKISGHKNYRTYLRYVRLSEEVAQEAGHLLDRRRAELEAAGAFGT